MSAPPGDGAGPDGRALAAVARALGTPPERLALRRLRRGVTHETLLVLAGGEPVAALRLAPPVPGVRLPGHAPGVEGRLLSALAGSGVPVPAVLLADPDGRALGREGLLLSYVPGHNSRSWEELRRHGRPAAAERALDALVALHRTDPARWAGLVPAGGHAGRDLARCRDVGDVPGATPLLSATLEALAADPPPAPAAPACVHGDFQPRNIMVARGRVTAVLDWEMATVGDPACDLGLATLAPWGRWWPDRELLARYERAGGARVGLPSLAWWRCLGYAKVVSFLARRSDAGWSGGPAAGPFAERMWRALGEWRRVAGGGQKR